MMVSISSYCYYSTKLNNWLWAVHVYNYPTGATVYLNETDIVVQEGDDGSTSSTTTVEICVVLAAAMGGLQRNILIDLTVSPNNANSK